MFCYLKRKAKANQEPPKSMADKLPGPITAVPFFLDTFKQVTFIKGQIYNGNQISDTAEGEELYP